MNERAKKYLRYLFSFIEKALILALAIFLLLFFLVFLRYVYDLIDYEKEAKVKIEQLESQIEQLSGQCEHAH